MININCLINAVVMDYREGIRSGHSPAPLRGKIRGRFCVFCSII